MVYWLPQSIFKVNAACGFTLTLKWNGEPQAGKRTGVHTSIHAPLMTANITSQTNISRGEEKHPLGPPTDLLSYGSALYWKCCDAWLRCFKNQAAISFFNQLDQYFPLAPSPEWIKCWCLCDTRHQAELSGCLCLRVYVFCLCSATDWLVCVWVIFLFPCVEHKGALGEVQMGCCLYREKKQKGSRTDCSLS